MTSHSLRGIAVTVQVLYFSFCTGPGGPTLWHYIAETSQIGFSALMCLLVSIQFIKQSLQMYKATGQFQLNRYMNLFMREGILYFLAYVHDSSPCFPRVDQLRCIHYD